MQVAAALRRKPPLILESFWYSAKYRTGIETRLILKAKFNKAGAEHQVSWGELKLGSWACHAYVLSDEEELFPQ
ncbi:MAG: hypothetical protein QM796_22840 [Chthoniobacteraceae bacterium]